MSAKAAALPAWVQPQLATLADAAPPGDDWVHEVKFDGYRLLARLERGKVTFASRNRIDWTARLPTLGRALARLPARAALLDGELVLFRPDGTTGFQDLQNMLKAGSEQRAVYCAFDLLHQDGEDLRPLPLLQRKARLAALLGHARRGAIRYSEHVVGQGPEFWAQACRTGLEGILSKRAAAPYQSARTRDWLKVKCVAREELVVVGWTEPGGSRTDLGALVLGTRDRAGGELRYAGRVGTGFTGATLRELARALRPLERDRAPLANPPRGAEARGVHWVEPRLVAEVSFTGWTGDGRLRHPSFQGLREDKPPAQVVRETPLPGADPPPVPRARVHRAGAAPARVGTVVVETIELTNPDRVLWPEQDITKRQLAEYFAHVAPRMLVHAAGRPLMFKRCPEGIGKACFFQKHVTPGAPKAIGAVELREESGKRAKYVTIADAAGLVALAQIGVLEVHGWTARNDRLEQPDRVVFDLDPGEDVEWRDVIAAARELRKVLDGVSLRSFVMTTGGKGLHVVAPLARTQGWEEVKAFASTVAEALATNAPDRYVATATKAIRRGRIFLDWLRNGRGATAVLPYSPRARPGAPVATPLAWTELGRVRSAAQFDLAAVRKRVRRDPWEGFTKLRQRLP